MTTYLTPPMQKGKEPPFYEMGALAFQDLCRDLLEIQSEFRDCRVYGDNGETQFGIDIRGERRDYGVEVAQAKCYKDFEPSDIAKATNKFMEHLQYWRVEGVKKFILIVACRISSVKSTNQIKIERQRFSEYGIEYELWDAVRIRDILREHGNLISTHITNAEHWTREICGSISGPPYSSQSDLGINFINELLVANVNNLSSVINSKVSKELENKRMLWREGNRRPVIEWITEMRSSDKEWNAVSPDLRANIIRLEAVVNIDYFENYQTASQLLDEAKEIDPGGFDLRIRASIALHLHGPQAGLEIIGDKQDIDSLCARASFHLHLNQPTETISLLENIQDSRNVEIYRLLALGYLANNELSKAVEQIQKAKLISEKSESVQIATAIISYFSTLSPAAVVKTFFGWPVPVELDLVKSRNDDIRALENASAIFLKISQNEYQTEANRLSLLVWQAACLAVDFQKQKEAEQRFGDLLHKYPTDHRIITWVVARNFSIDLKNSHAELKKLIKKGVATTADIISCAMIDTHFRRTRNTLYILEKNKEVFIKEYSEHLWEYWYVEILIANNKLEDARRRLKESIFHAEIESLTLMLLDREARASKNDQPFIDFILNSMEQENQSLYLMELCKYYASKKQWNQVVEYAERLVSEIQTYTALNLASLSLYNTGEFQECKAFIDKHISICFDHKLPNDLKLVYIQCMALTGQFSEALSDLRQLTEINPTTQNLVLLHDFYVRKGDQSGLKNVANLVKANANIRPDDLISFANSVLWASRELAEELWRLAPTDQLSPQMLAEKMLLGIALGLDHETKDINNLLPQIVGKKGVPLKQVTQEEAIAIIKNQNRQKNELFQLYSSGEIPIHVLAKNAGFNLFAFYKNIIRHNCDALITANQKFPLYVRYGGVPLLTDFREPDLPIEIGKLTLDVTSLLLLDNFSLLDALEETEQSIQIPNGIVLSLVQMKDDLERYQPEIVRACKLVSDYLAEEKIKVIGNKPLSPNRNNVQSNELLDFVASLKEGKGFAVGFGSQLADWSSLDHEKGGLNFSTCADIIESLRLHGGITEGEKIIGIERLGNDGQIRTNSIIPPGSNLYFVANTITQIAQTELLRQICNYYSIWIESNEFLSIRASIKDEQDRSTFASKLQVLTDRISRGLDEKRYVFLPYSMSEQGNENKIQSDLFIQNLLENINANLKTSSTSVVDDLVVQKILHIRGTSIYGIYEIAWLLYKRGGISEARFYETLSDFRKADLRYIPISSDEILFHLRQSSIENQQLIENSKLKTLRSAFAASLLFGRRLQIPSLPFNEIESQGEYEYLLSLVHGVTYAIIKIWKDDLSEEHKVIQSAWIIDNLFWDFLTLCEIVGWKRDPQDHLFLVALSLSSFFLHGLQFQGNSSDAPHRRKYFEWVYYTICEPRFRANPDLLRLTADHIKKTLSTQISDGIETKSGQVMRALCERLYHDLPSPIKALLERDKEFLQNIGVEIISVIQISDILFPARRFWNQFSRVVSGESQVIQSVQPKSGILFSPFASKDTLGGTFVHPETKQEITVKSTDFTFLINKDYETWVDENVSSFLELSRQELREQAHQISGKKDPADRLELLDKFRKSSIGNIYENLKGELVNTQTLNFNHLNPPSLEGLAVFCGFQNNRKKASKVGKLFNRGAKNLRSHLGLFSAISRFSAFPVAMPAFLIEEIRNLTLDERNVLFAEMFISLITPVSRAHLIKILVEYPDEGEKTTKLINSFFSEEIKHEIDAFLQLLSWVTDELDGQQGSKNWSPEIKLLLAWEHSNQLFSIFKNSSVPFDWLYSILKEKRASSPFKYMFSTQPLIWKDIAFGRSLDWLSFKILGLNYALQGHNRLPVELQDHILAEIFPWNENSLFPTLDLLKDRSIYSNQLSSFFGDDLSWAMQNLLAIEVDRLSILNSTSLRDLASSAIDWLANPASNLASSVSSWQLLLGIYHNQVLPDNLLESFDRVVPSFDFESLVRENPTTGFMGLFFSACQSRYLSGDAKKYLYNQISILAKVCATLNYETENSGRTMSKDEITAILLDSAIRLSTAENDEIALEKFSGLVIEITTNWGEVKLTVLHLLNNLIKEMPIPKAQKLGKVLLQIRSEH